MPDRHCQQQLLREQHLHHDALGIVRARPDEGHVQLALGDCRKLSKRFHLRDPQDDAGALLAEGQHGEREQAREGSRGDIADLDVAEHAAPREVADGFCEIKLPQRISRLGQEQQTGVGQSH